MTDDSGIQSIDFLAGFTIFMVAFIWVATMVPGLFIGIQSYTIDYDAVAYRTGVILAEDPGQPVLSDLRAYKAARKGSFRGNSRQMPMISLIPIMLPGSGLPYQNRLRISLMRTK